MVAAAIVGAGALGAAGSLLSSRQSSQASQQSAQLQAMMFEQQYAQQMPFIQAGQGQIGNYTNIANQGAVNAQNAFGQASNLLGLGSGGMAGALNALQQTPGYQFTLQQGLLATQNANAAQGLGVSGAALRGAADYASGLASTTYQNQLANMMNFGGQQAGYVANLANLGQSAAANVGQQSVAAGQNIGAATQAAGQAQAAGISGAANSLASTALLGALGNTWSFGPA